jgi:signal transduction histidine kinase
MIGRADIASTRMMLLINDLLDIEKIKSGMMKLEMSHVFVSELFEMAAGTVIGLLDDKSINLVRREADIEVLVDPDRMTQVLVNLISNAIKFSPQGSEIILSAEQNGGVEICVSDSGTGIPRDMLDKIFDRFQQVKVSDSKKLGGSGLGLAICKAIVELHGGTIWAESQNGKGSTFKIQLPIKRRESS